VGDEYPHLGGGLVLEADLVQRTPPESELIGDDVSVLGVALGLAAVGVAGPVDGYARHVEDPFAPSEQHCLQEGGRSAQEVDPDRALPAQPLDLRAGRLQVLLRRPDPVGEHLLAFFVQHADPMERLAHVETYPVPHRPPPFAPRTFFSPFGSPAVRALRSDLSPIPISSPGAPWRTGWPCVESPRGTVLYEPCPIRRATTELYFRGALKL
jgi:hypothetical protein